MKKVMMSLFVPVLLSGFVYAKDKKTDWQEWKLKDKVKSYIQTKYDAKEVFGEIKKGQKYCLYDCIKVVFDKNGRKLEQSNYGENGKLESKSIYLYDANGNNLELNSYKHDGSLSSKWVFKYDDNNHKIEKSEFKSDGSLYRKYNYKYDNAGNNIEIVVRSDKYFIRKIVDQYNKDNNIIKSMTYDANGKLTTKVLYKYDTNGNKTEVSMYDANNKLVSKTSDKYDSKGNNIESVQHYSDSFMSHSNGKYEYKYDIHNNEIEEIFYKDNGVKRKYTYKYKYDKKSNWTQKIKYKNGVVATEIIEREFEYYE